MAAAAVFPVPAPAAPPQLERRALRGSSCAGALAAAQALAGNSAGRRSSGAAVIGFLEARLRPMVVTAAQAQAQNAIAGVIEHAIWEQLGEEEITYSDLVTIQRDPGETSPP